MKKLGVELLDFQKWVFLESWNKPFVVWCMGRSSGKALSLDTKIPTLTGFKTMGDLQVGDYVLDENGNPTKITYVSDVFYNHKCYEVIFEDGERIIADADHLWNVKVSDSNNTDCQLKNTFEMSGNYIYIEKKYGLNKFKYSVPLSKPIKDMCKTSDNNNYKDIVSIKEVSSVPTKCISVDNKSKLYLCGEKFTVTHNTTLGAPFIMAKSMLIPNFQTYILAGVGSQSQEMFMKIEKIAKKEIASFTGLTDVFLNETVKSVANKDGFTHDPSSFKYRLYNGSATHSLNGDVDNLRSKRSNLNFYDESGFAPDALFTNSEPFCTQNSDFRLGGDVDVTLFPRQFPNQLIYASSASSVDTYFFKKYRDFSMKMFLGDKRYFVADINSDVVTSATYNGKIYPVPLLSQEVIDAAIRQNAEKAMREYKNIFTTEGGNNQIIKRSRKRKNRKSVEVKLTRKQFFEEFLLHYERFGMNCRYTGAPLTTISNRGSGQIIITQTNLSVDRIDNSLPYQVDNIVFCTHEFNNRKGSVRIDDCKKILKVYEERKLELKEDGYYETQS